MPNKLYTVAAVCHVCQKEFKARYNVGDRAKVCTPKGHRCRKGKKRGRSIPCTQNCCRSQYRQGVSASIMGSAIDPRKFLSDQEFSKMVKASQSLKNGYGVGIRFIAFTGCRLGEAFLVRREALQWKPGDLSVVGIPTLKRKGRPVRPVDLKNSAPFTQELRKFCQRMSPKDLVFGGLVRRTLQRRLEKILDDIKPDRVSLVHLLRHTHASQLIAAGADWSYVRMRLGWSSLEMAKLYVHTDEKRVSKVLGAMS